MKKILIEREIGKVLLEKKSFLNRAEVRLFTAASHDEALAIHRAERVDLIITDLDAPGIGTEQFCAIIRKDPELLHVGIIMVCACDTVQMSRSRRYGVDAIILRPIKPSFVLAKAKQLLNLSWRESYRVFLDVTVEGKANDAPFSCRSLDIGPEGLHVETTRVFTLGERVVCSFQLPDATQIRARGEVVRNFPADAATHANRYGIHFQDLTPDQSKAIVTFLDSPARKRSSDIY